MFCLSRSLLTFCLLELGLNHVVWVGLKFVTLCLTSLSAESKGISPYVAFRSVL